MPFLPTLRATVAASRRRESKVVAPVAFAQYYASVAGMGHSPTRDWPIERAVAEGYDRVMWVFKSVNTIAADSARLPFRLYEGLDEENLIEDHPLYRVLNKKANPLETGQVFRKRLSAQILLSKRGAFVEVTKSNAGSVIRLDLLPPDRIDIVPGTGADLIDHFRLNRRNGSVKNLDPESVRWFRDPHPIDPYMGTTPLESAGMSIELDHFARLYNVSFMQNDGRPGGILAVRGTGPDGGDVDEKHMDRIESRFGKGPIEAGKLSVVAGQLDYVDLAARPRDMQYKATADNARMEILGAFGIGESVFGNAAGRTFDNADNELYVYWTRTMPAHHEIILTGFDEDSEDELHGFLDTSKVEVLERAAKAARSEAREEVSAGLRSLYSYAQLAKIDDIESTPHTRALYIPSGKTPLPSQEADAEALGLGAPEEEAPAGEDPMGGPPAPGAPGIPGPGEPPALPGRTDPDAPDEPGAPAPGIDPAAARRGAAAAALAAVAGRKSRLHAIEGGRPKARTVLQLSRTESKDSGDVSEPDEATVLALEAEIVAALVALVERWEARADTRLTSPKQRKGTRHWTPEHAEDTRVGTKALDTAKAVDAATWQREAEQAVYPIVQRAALAAAIALMADFHVTPPPGLTVAKMAAQAIAGTVESVVGMVGRAAANQATKLIADLNTADQDGEDLTSITGVIRDRAKRLLGGWVTGLSIQTATATTNLSRDDAAREASRDEQTFVQREWLSRRDTRVRPTHKVADGQVRGLDEPFIVGDSLLRVPGDPLAPLHETANCRCRLRHRSRTTGRFVTAPQRQEASR